MTLRVPGTGCRVRVGVGVGDGVAVRVGVGVGVGDPLAVGDTVGVGDPDVVGDGEPVPVAVAEGDPDPDAEAVGPGDPDGGEPEALAEQRGDGWALEDPPEAVPDRSEYHNSQNQTQSAISFYVFCL